MKISHLPNYQEATPEAESAALPEIPKKSGRGPKIPRVVTIDFETHPIESRPAYPPVPVGVAITLPGRKPHYYAWGHPSENNCTFEEARAALLKVWESGAPLLFHNGKFDVDVAETFMGCPPLDWRRYHDTMFLIFYVFPYSRTLALKPAAESILGMPPSERDAVEAWILEHVPEARKNKKQLGRYICLAPGKLVGEYGVGDVVRTTALFERLWPEVADRGMLEAYDRDRHLMPFLLDNERAGVRVNQEALEKDIPRFLHSMERVSDWIRKRLDAPDLNLDAPAAVAEALDRSGVVTEWAKTAKGGRSMSKDTLTVDKFNDPRVASALGYVGRMGTCLGTFLGPWLETAQASGGLVFTNWNQVRQDRSGGTAGARTGRLSSNPNLMNIPKAFGDKGDDYVHPGFLRVLKLPLCRDYMLPDLGELWGHRDYTGQELRILAHFENGPLYKQYLENPRLDVHAHVQALIQQITGTLWPRRHIKTINFGKIYGMGVALLAFKIHDTIEAAAKLSSAHKRALPGVGELERKLKGMSRSGLPIVTWGGRQYFVEPPKMVDGRFRSFEYKLLNYLIQGSGADCTKQALINYSETPHPGRFLVTVHDEINFSAPPKEMREGMHILDQCMRDVDFRVPMLSDGEIGECWGKLEEFKE